MDTYAAAMGGERDRGRLAPDADPPVGEDDGEKETERPAEDDRDRELDDEVGERLDEGPRPFEDERGDREREHGAGRVVQRRLGDDRLSDLRPDAQALEERDEDRRIGRCEHGPDQEAGLERDAEDPGGGNADDESGEKDARDGEEAEADADPSEERERELEAAVEEDEGDAEREEELDADRVERKVDEIEGMRAEHDAGGVKHDHARQAQHAGEELGDEARREDDRERLDHLSRAATAPHSRRPTARGSLREQRRPLARFH